MVSDEWPPVTQDFGGIRAPVEPVVERLQAWHAGVAARYRTQRCTDTLQVLARGVSSARLAAALDTMPAVVLSPGEWRPGACESARPRLPP